MASNASVRPLLCRMLSEVDLLYQINKMDKKKKHTENELDSELIIDIIDSNMWLEEHHKITI